MMHEDEEPVPFIEVLEEPNLSALSDLVTSLRCARMAALRYQFGDEALSEDAPSGVLEEVQKAEVHLANAIASLGASISLENDLGGT